MSTMASIISTLHHRRSFRNSPGVALGLIFALAASMPAPALAQPYEPIYVLPAVASRLADSYYDAAIAANPATEAHRFVDHNSGTTRFAVWTDTPPQPLDLSAQIAGLAAVIDHAGTVTFADGAALVVGLDPSVVTAAIPGDFNADGAVATDDLDPFVTALLDPALDAGFTQVADMNADGSADAWDIAPFIAAVLAP